MHNLKVSAVTLRSTDYRESDKILTLFTPEKGLISARLRGVKKARARLKYAAEPFCYAEFELVRTRGMYTVTGCRTLEHFHTLREDLNCFYAAGVMLRFCLMFVQPEEEGYEELFKHFVMCLTLLKHGAEAHSTVLCYFLLHALKFSGYSLQRRIDLSVQKYQIDMDSPVHSPLADTDSHMQSSDTPLATHGNGRRIKGTKQGAAECLARLFTAAPQQVIALSCVHANAIIAAEWLCEVCEKATEQRFTLLREYIGMVK